MIFKNLLKRIVSILIYGIISTMVAFLISLLIQKSFGFTAYDSMTTIGLIIVCIGALSTVGGIPAGIDMRNTDDYSEYNLQLNLEVIKVESEVHKYIKRTANCTKLYFSSKLNIIFNGIFVILTSIIISLYL